MPWAPVLSGRKTGLIIAQSPGNRVGGPDIAERNVISGNLGTGSVIGGVLSTGNHVQGNFIGTDQSGTVAVHNEGWGIYVAGSADNVIGGTAAVRAMLCRAIAWGASPSSAPMP